MINNIPTFIDVGIVHPSTKSYRREKRRLEIARRYEQGKIRKYTDMAMDNNGVIIPFIIESNGGFGETANYVTADVAALANQDALAFVPSEIVKDMLDGVAVAVQKGNALAIRRSLEVSMSEKWRRGSPSLLETSFGEFVGGNSGFGLTIYVERFTTCKLGGANKI